MVSVVFLSVLYLIIFHGYLVAQNVTTIEYYKVRNAGVWQCTFECSNTCVDISIYIFILEEVGVDGVFIQKIKI